MKKEFEPYYELIQTYPGAETLGIVIDKEGFTENRVNLSRTPANFPLYWEPIFEPELYEVLAVKIIGKKVTEPIVRDKKHIKEALRDIRKGNKFFEVQEILRKSDKEVFVKTYQVINPREGQPPLSIFKITPQENGQVFLEVLDAIGRVTNLNMEYVRKYVPPPIEFTTEDGVKITDRSQRVPALLCKEPGWEKSHITIDNILKSVKSPHWKYFSSEDERAAYEIKNRNLLSYQDILAAQEITGSRSFKKFLVVLQGKVQSKYSTKK